MKVITWNCNMAFRKKIGLLLEHKPDILIIPECEHPDKMQLSGIQAPTKIIWQGDNHHKGLAILSFGNFTLKHHRFHNPQFRFVVPVAVRSEHYNFTLYGIWANNPNDKDGPYVEQTWKAVNYYKKHLSSKPSMMAGDFNSNTIWDKEHRVGSHSNVVKFLEKKKIFSTYHSHYQQIQGKEAHPTQYMYRHKNKPYHLDYCFVSKSLLEKMQSIHIGDFETWSPYSDHMPIIIDFEKEQRR